MPAQLATFRALALAIAAASGVGFVCLYTATAARAQTSESVSSKLSPDRLGAKGALTLTIHYAGGEFGVPTPVRRSLVKLPAGLGLDIPALRSCSAARLRRRGPSGCPTQSLIGNGRALVESRAGSQLITEKITLWVFLGPLQNFQPTFEVLGQGYTPLEQRVVLGGAVIPDHAPYGEQLVMNIPPIPTLPFEPDASISTLVLTVGTSSHRLARGANTVVVPGSCPAGGFPFAAESSYADGSTSGAVSTAPCPP